MYIYIYIYLIVIIHRHKFSFTHCKKLHFLFLDKTTNISILFYARRNLVSLINNLVYDRHFLGNVSLENSGKR